MRTQIANALIRLALAVQPRKPIVCNVAINGTVDVGPNGLCKDFHTTPTL